MPSKPSEQDLVGELLRRHLPTRRSATGAENSGRRLGSVAVRSSSPPSTDDDEPHGDHGATIATATARRRGDRATIREGPLESAIATRDRILSRSMPETVVMKFGGTSVAEAEDIKRAARRIVAAREGGKQVVAVLSARGKTTDELVDAAYEISPRPLEREMDMLLSTGERISCALCAMAIHDMGH